MRWIAPALVLLAGLASGSGFAHAAVAGGGHFGGRFGGGPPMARGPDHGHVERGHPSFSGDHHRPNGFIFVYPYYAPYYGPFDPGYPYQDAYCDPWSSYYSPQACYGG